MKRRVAVVGGGWAGLAAAIEATSRGDAVSLFEMAGQIGGRARKVQIGQHVVDNGQHILIGAYHQTLTLMRRVGADPERLLLRTPLCLAGPDGTGLVLPPGPPLLAFLRGVAAHPHWSWSDRLALLGAATGWALRGFHCDRHMSVASLCAKLPAAIRNDLIDPLCVAALNTPADQASASVFLRVLKDALFSGAGSSDLLLPRDHLSALLPEPATAWLKNRGAAIHLSRRVMSVLPEGSRWSVDGAAFDAVVLATPPLEAARLARSIAVAWASQCENLRYQPIVTLYLRCRDARLMHPMIALPADAAPSDCPAQYVFDLGRLRGQEGCLAFVISGAQAWVDAGMEATVAATLAQARRTLGAAMNGPVEVLQALTEKRATFACTPALQRPPSRIAAGLAAAGDYCDGPYPATLEGAVRSGLAAIDSLSSLSA